MRLPTIDTARLRIREFVLDDLDDVHRALDVELATALGEAGSTRAERERWLYWTVVGYRERELLCQPPYADYALERRGEAGRGDALIGACGIVPSLVPLARARPLALGGPRAPEVGLYYALAPAAWGQGYATEAARALADWAMSALGLARVVATTSRDNARSRAVMERIGMTVLDNPEPGPRGLQVVGVLER